MEAKGENILSNTEFTVNSENPKEFSSPVIKCVPGAYYRGKRTF